MESQSRLRRSKSLKNILPSRSRRDSAHDELKELPPPRPVKQTYVQFRITSDDIAKQHVEVQPTLQPRLRSSRETWPPALREKRPGSYAFDETPTLTKTPWEYDRARRPPSQWSRNTGRSSLSENKCAQLPREIIHCIFDHVRDTNSRGNELNVVDLRRDLKSLCAVDKAWHRVAREHLYREIWLPSQIEPQEAGLLFRKKKGRLELLRRTLEEAPGLARLVFRLHITSLLHGDISYQTFPWHSTKKSATGESLSLVIGIVGACPNLQSLSGLSRINYEHEVNVDLHNTLATRTQLREHVWRFGKVKPLPYTSAASCEQWQRLETLVLWQHDPRRADYNPGVVSVMVQRLPSLRHLVVKGLTRADFHNGTLLMLPPLNALRLEDVPGITDHGIEQLAHSRLASSLEKVTLIGVELTSLRTIQAVFSNFDRLRRFTLVQRTTPELQGVATASRAKFTLASHPLEYLHWSAFMPGNALALLANEIMVGNFPSLHTVKVPYDHDGAIQYLCRPIAQRPFTSDDLDYPSNDNNTPSIKHMRLQAQDRARQARRRPSVSVVVQDEDDKVRRTHVIGSYLGNIASSLTYSMEPDVEGSDSPYARIEDLLHRDSCVDNENMERDRGLDVLF